MSILDRVKLNPNGEPLAGWQRLGTVFGTTHQLQAALGGDHSQGDGLKVTKEWYVETPAGRAMIHDYHLNQDDEWSIATDCEQAAMYTIEYALAVGLDAGLLPREAS